MPNYTVSLSFSEEAGSPEEAVEITLKNILRYGHRVWEYLVIDHEADERWIVQDGNAWRVVRDDKSSTERPSSKPEGSDTAGARGGDVASEGDPSDGEAPGQEEA